jgi:septal ring factor EnvC (AmiA/AmiB activator)
MKKTLLLVLVLVSVVFTNAQKTKDQLQKEEAELKKEMNELTNDLARVHGQTKSSLKAMALIQRKKAVVEERVSNINKQVRAIDEDIYHNELEIYRMKKELDTLKTKYAQSIVFAYKNRSSYQYLNFLFSATSFNDAIKRMTYLKSYRQLRETQVDNIVKTQNLLQEQMTTLTGNKKEQSQILVKQQDQLREAEETRKEQDRIVKELKNQEKDITAQLRKKEKQRQDMKKTILTIIRREEEATARREKEEKRIKKEKEDQEKARLAAKNITPTPSSSTAKTDVKTSSVPKTTTTSTNESTGGMTLSRNTTTYSKLEGSEAGVEQSILFERKNLPWPVSIGTVVIPFGNYSAGPKLIGHSDGIDIALPVGTNVTSVADGKVSFVGDVGGEQIVIVKHGKYLTSYGLLSSISVSKDQMVKAGTLLGKSGTDDDGQGMMQFLVINEKGTFLNPKIWLRNR